MEALRLELVSLAHESHIASNKRKHQEKSRRELSFEVLNLKEQARASNDAFFEAQLRADNLEVR